jgi:hypothetical protein
MDSTRKKEEIWNFDYRLEGLLFKLLLSAIISGEYLYRLPRLSLGTVSLPVTIASAAFSGWMVTSLVFGDHAE